MFRGVNCILHGVLNKEKSVLEFDFQNALRK